MQAKDLITWRKLSKLLTGNPEYIRSGNYHTVRQHSEAIKGLLDYIETFIEKHKKE